MTTKPSSTARGHFLLYGSYGYTGDLIARMSVERGMRPTLAGRDSEKLRLQALSLGLDHRPFSLENPRQIDEVLQDYPVVLHCAGPFAHTAKPMAESCIRTGAHYLDVTGEIIVFEALAAMDKQAREAGVMLLPGIGFDVVPTDCLALHLKNHLPTATHLTLAYLVLRSSVSRGTATTSVENIHKGSAVRRDGKIVPVPAGWKTRKIDFGRGPKKSVLIPWGDVSTAWYSTGIPNVEVYSGSHTPLRPIMILSRYIGGLLGSKPVQNFLKARVRALPPGPTPKQLANGKSIIWGEVTDPDGNRFVSRQYGPEGYRTTALTALAAVEKILDGNAPPGFQTPSKAYGADFILEIEGMTREDLA
ncbi:MAG: saccharopine dehydrogenase family protein [Anaerolineales bacterium]